MMSKIISRFAIIAYFVSSMITKKCSWYRKVAFLCRLIKMINLNYQILMHYLGKDFDLLYSNGKYFYLYMLILEYFKLSQLPSSEFASTENTWQDTQLL